MTIRFHRILKTVKPFYQGHYESISILGIHAVNSRQLFFWIVPFRSMLQFGTEKSDQSIMVQELHRPLRDALIPHADDAHAVQGTRTQKAVVHRARLNTR